MDNQPTDPNTTPEVVEPVVETTPEVTPAPEPTPEPVQTEPAPAAPEDRRPAVQVLEEFLNANNMDLSIPPVTVREVKDGSLIIDTPTSVVVRYKDE